MTTSWAILLLCCMAVGVASFSAARLGRVAFERSGDQRAGESEALPQEPPPIESVPVHMPAPSRRLPVAPPPAYPEPAPEPTAPQPDGRLLELWALQVEEGARKMTVATDGCRVTWNRRCKHGHPAWIVYLGQISTEID